MSRGWYSSSQSATCEPYCHVRRVTTQTFPTSLTRVEFDGTDPNGDPWGLFVPPFITIAHPGWYYCGAQIHWVNATVAVGGWIRMQLEFLTSPAAAPATHTIAAESRTEPLAHATLQHVMGCSGVVGLPRGHVLGVQLQQTLIPGGLDLLTSLTEMWCFRFAKTTDFVVPR